MYTSNRLRIEQTNFMLKVDSESTTTPDYEQWKQRRDLELELMKLARSHHRLQEAACCYELTPRQQSRDQNIEKRIRSIVFALGLSGVLFSGDPRGATVKLLLPSGDTNDWGRTGWIVPTF